MTGFLYGPNVLFALLGASGVLAMFYSLYIAAPSVKAKDMARFAQGEDLGWRGRLQQKIEQAGLEVTADEFIRISVVSAVVTGTAGYFGTGTVSGLVIGIALSPFGYWTYLENKRDKRRQAYQEGLARAIAIVRDSVAAGKALHQSIEDVARRGPKNIRPDFEDIITQMNIGVPFAQALETVRKKRNDPILNVFAEILMVHTRYGGEVAPILETLADATNRRTDIRRRIAAEQAQVVWEARIMSIAPLLMVFISRYTMASAARPFYASIWGEVTILLITLIGAGSYWLVMKFAGAPLKILDSVFVAPDD